MKKTHAFTLARDDDTQSIDNNLEEELHLKRPDPKFSRGEPPSDCQVMRFDIRDYEKEEPEGRWYLFRQV